LTRDELEVIDLDEISIVHFGSATAFLPGPLQALSSLLHKAMQKNIFISFDPNYRQLLIENIRSFVDQSWNFLTCCNFLSLVMKAILITGAATLSDAAKILLEKTTAVFAITLG
jgi:fructokinase